MGEFRRKADGCRGFHEPEAPFVLHVSPEVAESMAQGAIARFGADVGVGITGIAGPDGGTEEKPVGYVCICALLASGEKLAHDPVLPGTRDDVRERSVVVALHLVRHLLLGSDPPR